MKKLSVKQLNIIFSVLAIAAMILIWVIAYYCVGNNYIVPSVPATLKSFFMLFADATFWTAFGFTFLRTVEAFAVSFVLAAVFAALSVLYRGVKTFLKPVMSILRTLPTLAIILLLLVWTTISVAPVIVTVLVLFPAMYAQFMAAAGEIDGGLKEMCNVYGISKKERIFKIYLPLVSPNIFSQLGANISLGLKITISAEVLAHTARSLGNLMQNAKLNATDMPLLAALTIASVVMGLLLEFGLGQLARINKKWQVSGND